MSSSPDHVSKAIKKVKPVISKPKPKPKLKNSPQSSAKVESFPSLASKSNHIEEELEHLTKEEEE